jgi:hypothetical protein
LRITIQQPRWIGCWLWSMAWLGNESLHKRYGKWPVFSAMVGSTRSTERRDGR